MKKEKGYKIYRSYIKGFLLSIIITIISFAMVYYHALPKEELEKIIIICAITQILTQSIFFLHLNRESKWNIVSLGFAMVVITIIVVGTLWVILDLYSKMM